jgi:hypothetical protein
MPYPSTHAARMSNPGDYRDDSFRSIKITDGVTALLASPDDDVLPRSLEVQSYRFDADQFTAAEAKAWLADKKLQPIKFEPAVRKEMNDDSVEYPSDVIRKAVDALKAELHRQVLTKKYDDISFKPPAGVAEAAELGLEWRGRYGRGGTMIGVARARDLKNRATVSPETISRMVGFFTRHASNQTVPKNANSNHPQYPGAGRIAWLLWGGDAGRRWANKVYNQMKREDAKKAWGKDDKKRKKEKAKVTKRLVVSVSDNQWDDLVTSTTVMRSVIKGDRFVIDKTENRTVVRNSEDNKVDISERLATAVSSVPSYSAVEVTVSDDGKFAVSDVLAVNSVLLDDLSFGERLELAKDLFSLGNDKTDWVHVQTAEDLVLEARVISEHVTDHVLEIRNRDSAYGEPMLELELSKSVDTLWSYVPPVVPGNVKALFVSGSPNKIESIRAKPLSGIDGATFKSAYLEELGLTVKDVAIMHCRPCRVDDGRSWTAWLQSKVSQFPDTPVIALGKSASKALEGISHHTFPHPAVVRTKGNRGEVKRKSRRIVKHIDRCETMRLQTVSVPIIKRDDEKRIVYGIVLEPHSTDLQGDTLTVDTIEVAAHKYLTASRVVGDGHSRKAEAEVVESYIAPADVELGGQTITKGTWIMGVHILKDELWDSVKAGNYTGFSIGGTGERKKI